MATRFGGPSPAREYLARSRWIISCLLALVTVLCIALVMAWQHGFGVDDSSLEITPVANATITETKNVQVISAARRIGAGEKIQEDMLKIVEIPESILQESYINADKAKTLHLLFANSEIPQGAFLVNDALSVEEPKNPFFIPAGHRAVSITVDARTGVEGFAKPNTQVDVLWVHKGRRDQQEIATIVKTARVLSVAGLTHVTQGSAPVRGAETTVTLLVTSQNAKVIELARATGVLSLALVGENEGDNPNDEDEKSLNYQDLLRIGSTGGDLESKPIEGTAVTYDRVTGRPLEFVLTRDRWERDHPEELSEKARSRARLDSAEAKRNWLKEKVSSTAEKTK